MARILRGVRPTLRPALAVASFLWPRFLSQHGCIFVTFDDETDFNPPPESDTATGWEAFVNHTHIFDEFRNKATQGVVVGGDEFLTVIEETYDEMHPDFIAACELGRKAALLWAVKLKRDFPEEDFRVYYTEYDNPIIRFHKVRHGEAPWISDSDVLNPHNSDFRNGMIFDTRDLSTPISAARVLLV